MPPADKKLVQSNCSKILPKAEALRESLRKRFEEEHEAYQARTAALAAQAEKKVAESSIPNSTGNNYEVIAGAYNPPPSAPPPYVRPLVSTPNLDSIQPVSAYSDIMADVSRCQFLECNKIS